MNKKSMEPIYRSLRKRNREHFYKEKFDDSFMVYEFNGLSTKEKEELFLLKDAAFFMITDISFESILDSILRRHCFLNPHSSISSDILERMERNVKVDYFKDANKSLKILSPDDLRFFLYYSKKIREVRNRIAHEYIRDLSKFKVKLKEKRHELADDKKQSKYRDILLKLYGFLLK